MTTSYTVFTRNMSDHNIVHVIASEISDYADASRIARRCSGCIMFSDQFAANFTATSVNEMDGTLA